MHTYTEDEVRAWLDKNLPRWTLEEEHIVRIYQTGSWQRTLLVAGSIAFMAESAWHHPELRLNYPSVEVRLQTHDAGGITDRDFELARRIESQLTWTPPEGSAFESPPGEWIS